MVQSTGQVGSDVRGGERTLQGERGGDFEEFVRDLIGIDDDSCAGGGMPMEQKCGDGSPAVFL